MIGELITASSVLAAGWGLSLLARGRGSEERLDDLVLSLLARGEATAVELIQDSDDDLDWSTVHVVLARLIHLELVELVTSKTSGRKVYRRRPVAAKDGAA